MAETPERIDDGIWRWTARHPEWHPVGFGDEVASFALKTDAELLLIDPLLPADPAPIHELVDAEAGESGIAVLITIPYHVRDAERLRREHGTRCTIWGHEACVSRLEKRAGFHAITPQTELPAGVRAHAIGSPRRQEQPLWIPSHKALAFGDAVIETGGRLRVWEDDLDSEQRTRWYRDRFIPTLKPLLDLGPERVLVTHGDPVLVDGRAKLSSALWSKPWNRRHMSRVERDPERGRAVAAELKRLGVKKRELIRAAEQGYITELACKMPECFCPEELGGASYFAQVTTDWSDWRSDWIPTLEHFPVYKKDGGKATVENAILAHRLCNRIDHSLRVGRSHERDLERIRKAREEGIRRNNERS